MITLDGHKLDYFGLKLERGHSHPMTPPTRERTLSIPGKSGKWDFGSEWDSLSFEFPLAVIEMDKYELQRKLRAFVAFLLDPYGRPRVIKLVHDYEPDKHYLVKYSGQMTPGRLVSTGQFSLPLIAHDSFAKFIVPSDEIIMDSDIPIMSDLMWDTGFSNRNITTPQTFTIINNGSLAILFAFKVVGSGDNVAFSANGKTMTLGTFNNKTYEITDNYTVKVDGITNLTSTNGVFLELMPGVNEINVTGSNLNLTISESLTYKYV